MSWDVQALLWATEVEGLAESDVVRRLGQVPTGRDGGLAAVRLAYLDLRRDLDVDCAATLRGIYRSTAVLRSVPGTPIRIRALCVKRRQGGSRTLDLLCAACLRRYRPTSGRKHDSSPWKPHDAGRTTPPGPIEHPHPECHEARPMHSRRGAAVVLSASDQARVAVGDATTATSGREPALV